MAGRDVALGRFVAGLVPAVTGPELDAALAGALTPDARWRADGARLPKPHGELSVDWLPRWHDPGDVSPQAAATLASSWRRVTAGLPTPDFLRVSVAPGDRLAAAGIGSAAGLPVVPSLAWLSGTGFTWHCPIRVTAAGPGADALIAELRALPLAGEYFGVVPEGPADICFLTENQAVPPECHAAVVIGDADPLQLLGNGIFNTSGDGVALAAGVPRTDLSWWPQVVRELARNVPLDCALASVVPEAWVGGVSAALTATTLEFTYDVHGWRGPAADVVFVGPGTEPADGAGRPGQAEAEPPGTDDQAGAEPPPGPDPRRLVVEFRDGGRRVRTVLPPKRDLTLEVAIAVPGRGQPHGDVPVADPGDPGVVMLDVVASGELWAEPQLARIAWPVSEFTQPSTSAVFTLTTPATGSAVSVNIAVLYQGRPLQKADVVAAVRDVALPGERVRVVVLATSTPPAPSLLGTRAETSLDATGSDLRNTFTGASIPLARLDGQLDALEQLISRTLAPDDAPESLDDPRALALLVDLARAGESLHVQLAGLGLDGTGAISLLTQPQARLLPLELVYAGVAPQKSGVRLCEHARTPPPPGTACDRTGRRTVCPYAFWALSRTIARSVVLPGSLARVLPDRVDLRTPLYASAAKADDGSPKSNLPGDELAAACTGIFGSVDRVRSWTAWRREVAATKPKLLVLLSHTDVTDGEAWLLIGRKSYLLRPDISAAVVGSAPLVVLVACASAVADDPFGTLAGTFTARGAAAVVGMLSKLAGPQAWRATATLLRALADAGRNGPHSLGAALATARRDLVGQGLLVGMMIVAHGEIDVMIGG